MKWLHALRDMYLYDKYLIYCKDTPTYSTIRSPLTTPTDSQHSPLSSPSLRSSHAPSSQPHAYSAPTDSPGSPPDCPPHP